MYLLLLLLFLIDSLQKNTFNYQSKLSKDQILAFFRKSFQGQKRRRRIDYIRARQGAGRPSPEILDPCFQEKIIYIQVFSGSRNPARNPDLQIFNPETGPKPRKPGPLPSPGLHSHFEIISQVLKNLYLQSFILSTFHHSQLTFNLMIQKKVDNFFRKYNRKFLKLFSLRRIN